VVAFIYFVSRYGYSRTPGNRSVMSDCPVCQLQPWLYCTCTSIYVTLDHDYDNRVRSSPSFDTMMQSNVRGWRVRFIKSGMWVQ
jgi:hypothetical protein